MFVDTSALIAILAREDDGPALFRSLQESAYRVTSGVVMLEATMRLTTLLRDDPAKVLVDVEAFLAEMNVEIIPLDADHARIAVQAFATYGKGRGHPAQLNLADCLSYASAKSKGLPMLYKGNDFSQTDLAGPAI